MKENCFDIGTIQAFLDGELSPESAENAACHIALCDDCAFQLATAEDETAVAFNALEQEFNTLVPTQRLWTKINDSIERERRSFWTPILVFFRNPAMATFAACLIVFGLFVAYLNSGSTGPAEIAKTSPSKTSRIAPVSNPEIAPASGDTAVAPVEKESFGEAKVASAAKTNKNYRAVNADLKTSPRKNSSVAPPKNDNESSDENRPQIQTVAYLPGEESYIKTISTLEKTIDQRKDEVLRPSSRMAYEKDLALVNDAIQKMKTEVKNNPKNESAKQILLASYQSKVDLLNSVAAKTELMASR